MEYWLALLAASVILLPALFSDKSPIRLLFGAPENYPKFVIDDWKRILGIALVAAALLTLAGAQLMLRAAEQEFEAHKTKVDQERADERAAKLAEEEARKHADELRRRQEEIEQEQARIVRGVEALAATVASLRQSDYSEVEVVRNTPTLRIVQGTKRVEVGDLEATEIRMDADDQYGTKKAVLVFHVFENSAVWKYDSAHSFERWRGGGVNVIAEISRSPQLRKKLLTYDMIVGVGLASNSPSQPARTARDRAAFLCGGLQSFRRKTGAEVFGLSIGNYVGKERDTTSSPQRLQRVVAIVGVIKQSALVPETALIQEIMASVRGSGLDLLSYSLMQPGKSPEWIAIQQCSPI